MTTETLITEPAKTETATGAESGADPSSQQANEQTATGAGEGGQQQQASEGQTGEGQQTEAAKTDDGQKKPDEPKGAPEQYAEFKAPEGVTFDTGVIGEFSKAAKELDLPQDKAQQLLDRMGPVMVARSAERLIAARQEWVGQVQADKEIGGDKLPENLAAAKKALDTFGTPELRTLLIETGLGDHPEMIRAFVRAGKAISEDTLAVGGKKPVGAGKSVAEILYDKTQE